MYSCGTLDAKTVPPDILIDWLFRACADAAEIHETPAKPADTEDVLAHRYLVAVMDEGATTPRLLKHAAIHLDLWLVPRSIWALARQGKSALPSGFGCEPVTSWRREPRHDDAASLVHSLVLENFRGFGHLRISFQPDFNILIGQNGTGKTTILDALALGLHNGLHAFHPQFGDSFAAARPEDVRMARVDKGGITQFERQLPTRVDVEMRLCGERIQPGAVIERFGDGLGVGSGRFIAPFDYIDLISWFVQGGFDVTLPLVAYYGSRRSFGSKPERSTSIGETSRFAAYRDCLNPLTNLSGTRAWFRRIELLALQEGITPPVLTASKEAIAECLDGFDLVRYDARLDDLAARSRSTGLALGFDQLSDGQKNVLGMVADMAYRAANLNPHLGVDAVRKTPGIVLIDEVDQHLHPAWQRRVIGDLQRAFPAVQFIVTTHSPQVLGQSQRGNIFILENFELLQTRPHTYGRDANSILGEVMGVPERPKDIDDLIRTTSQLVEEERLDDAKAALEKLASIVGDDDHMVVRIRTLMSFMDDEA
ncbi:MAG: AAA family ATPase [Polyangiaceae bacterium]|nr:AAA family ATPase [Polyangiaceae bacterium]